MRFSPSIALLCLAACDPDDRGPFEHADPRCASLCEIVEPPLSGAYDICSFDSASSCVDQCESRIGNVGGDCADCLLDFASFGTDPIDASAACDQGGNCTMEGPGGRCTYRADDPSDRDRCTRIVHPRREVECFVNFQSARNCTTTCS